MNPAFAYFYDDFLNDQRHTRDVAALEAELARRGIEGRMARLAMFRDAKEMVSDLASGGVKNIVFVGDDRTLKKMMWFLPDVGVTVGYVPLLGKSQLAAALKIPDGLAAVEVLAARLVDLFDVGKVNDRYFLTDVHLPMTTATLEIEGSYRLAPVVGGLVVVRNLGSLAGKNPIWADAKDGRLEAIVQPQNETSSKKMFGRRQAEETRIMFQRGRIMSATSIDLLVDGETVKGTDFVLNIFPKKLRLICGGAMGERLAKPSQT